MNNVMNNIKSVEVVTMTLPLKDLKEELKTMPRDIDELFGEYEDPLFEYLKELWVNTSQKLYGNGDSIRDIIKSDKTEGEEFQWRVILDDGTIEDYNPFEHNIV